MYVHLYALTYLDALYLSGSAQAIYHIIEMATYVFVVVARVHRGLIDGPKNEQLVLNFGQSIDHLDIPFKELN